VEQIGTPLDLYDTPQNVFVAGFIGSPSMNFLQGKIDGDDGKLHFLSDDGLIFPIPDAPVKSGDRVTYGIRPEHIELGENGMSFEISVLEPMGSETQIYAKSGAQKIDALVKDRLSSKPGMHVNFVINPEHVHLFDAQSENRI
jgi:multiple sugar transport system ATP-binding protein